MVRFAPVISSAAVARSQANNLQGARVASTGEFSVTASGQQKRQQAKLPSLYPAISLKSLRSRELLSKIDRDTPEVSSHNTVGSDSVQWRVNASQQSEEPKVKGTSLVVGSAGILRAATAVAVNNATAKITVHQAEEQIQEPECEVNNYCMGAL